MDTHYQPIYKQAAATQYKFHDYTHATAYDPAAKVLRNQMHSLTNDLAANKDPRQIEKRVRTIQTQLRRNQTLNPAAMPGQQPPILNQNQSQTLHRNLESIRKNITQHPNFK